MIQVILASEVCIKDIADFQCRMAMQTEKLVLDRTKVEKAVEYLLKHPQYGQYFLAVFQHQPEQICGSLLTTYENKESYWMQSVYVKEEHRRKGIFTTLFKTVTKRCADNGVKSLQLYTEKENHKAKSTYQSLGMYCNGNQFIGYQFVYADTSAIKHLEENIQYPIRVQQTKQHSVNSKFGPLKQICGEFNCLNGILLCLESNEVIGQCQYFTEFSDWRFGLAVYISYFCSVEGKEISSLESFIKYLRRSFEIQVAALRIIGKQNEVKRLKQMEPNLRFEVYDVMKIDL